MFKSVREVREDCPAEIHDSARAYQFHRCRCPRAREAKSRENRQRTERRARIANRPVRAKAPIRIVHEDRPNCPAPAHGTFWAVSRYRCECPEAIEDFQRFRHGPDGQPRGEVSPVARRGGYDYELTDDRADWVVAERIVSEGVQPGATRYDRWMAISILWKRNLSVAVISARVGVSRDTVKRYIKWMEDKDAGR